MKKLLFISSYDSSFVKSDIGILGKHFHLDIPKFKKSNRTGFDYLKMILRIFRGTFNSDLVFCWFADFAAFLAVKAANLFHKKVFVVVGGYEVSNLPGYGGLNDRKRVKRLTYTLKNATRVITISEFSKSEIDDLKLDIVPEKISIGVEQQNIEFSKFNLIITSGSVSKELYKLKGLDIFAQATSNIAGYQFKIIGPFDEEIKQQLLAINPQIEFTGKLSHKQFLELMKKAKVYCQFSQRESFGLAILEAMSMGCTPVVSNAGAMPEIVGEAGFICEYGDVESAEKAIRKAIDSELEKDISGQVTKKFTIQMREEKLIKMINQELCN